MFRSSIQLRLPSRDRFAELLVKNRPFIIVWLALFIAIIGIAMVSPLLPVFAEEMGATGVWLGFAFSGFTILQVPLMPVVGKLADKFNKKLFLWIGLVIYTVSALGYFWAPGYQELVIFRVFSGIGAAMVVPIAFSYVGELAPQGFEGRYMGLFNIAMIAGFGVGPMLGGTIHDALGAGATYLFMAGLSFAGFLVIILFLPAKPELPEGNNASEVEERASFLAILRDTGMRSIFVFQFVMGVLFGTLMAFTGIWLTGDIGATVAQVGIVLSVLSIVTGAFAYPSGWLADHMNRIILVSLGMGLVSVFTFSIPWLHNYGLVMLFFVFMGLCESIASPSISAITVEKGRSLGMGSVMGFFNMAMSIGLFAGSMVGGIVDDTLGTASVFRVAAVLALAGIGAFAFLMRNEPGIHPENVEEGTSTESVPD